MTERNPRWIELPDGQSTVELDDIENIRAAASEMRLDGMIFLELTKISPTTARMDGWRARPTEDLSK